MLQCPELLSHCYDKIHPSGQVVLTTSQLTEQLLKLFSEQICKQYIIIDGLDECDPGQRKSLLSILSRIVDECDERDPGKVRLLLVSQDYLDIRRGLPKASVLKLTPEHNKNDIRNYVQQRTRAIELKYNLGSDIVQFIHDTTLARSEGTSILPLYLWLNAY